MSRSRNPHPQEGTPRSEPVTRQDGLLVQSVDVELEARRILQDVSLQAGAGQFVGLLGPNGSGKTTLLRAINGFLQPVNGTVVFSGDEVRRMSPRRTAQLIARIPQSTALEFNFTVREAVLMGRHPHLGRFSLEGQQDEAIAQQALETVGMAAFSDRSVDTLSGGERQLVFVARALAQGPRLLLLDEPTANLDLAHQLQVMDLVSGLVRQGLTAIAALHDLSLAANYCTRIVLLSRGHVAASGTPEQVLTPDNIQRVFNVEVNVHRDPVSERLVIMPSRRAARATRSAHVHVIAGGGTGAHLMAALCHAGHRVTAGVLNEGDTDLATTRALGIKAIVAPPFAPISDRQHQQHLAAVRSADLVVLADVPFGLANIRNLEAAQEARRLLIIEGTPLSSPDFTDGKAAAMYNSLRAHARVTSREGLLAAVEQSSQEAPDVPAANNRPTAG